MEASGSPCLALLRQCAFGFAGQGGKDCHQAAEAGDRLGAFLLSKALNMQEVVCKMTQLQMTHHLPQTV